MILRCPIGKRQLFVSVFLAMAMVAATGHSAPRAAFLPRGTAQKAAAKGDAPPGKTVEWQPVGQEDLEDFAGPQAEFGARSGLREAGSKGSAAFGTTGACCFFAPPSCTVMTLVACGSAGGNYMGDKSVCANNICGFLTRACCDPTGLAGPGSDGCIGDMSQAACEAGGNTWHIQASCIGANGSPPDGTGPLPKPKCNRYDINNCVWDNGLPLNDGGTSRSHTHSGGNGALPRYEFNTADDFILGGPDSIPCEVNAITWYMRARPSDTSGPTFNPPNPPLDLVAVNVTVFEDFIDPNTGRNSPAGFGLTPADGHDLNPKAEYYAGGITYSRTFCTGTPLQEPGFSCPGPLGLLSFTLLGGSGGPYCDPPPAVGLESDAVYRVDITVDPPMLLNKHRRYWLDVQGVFPFNDGLRDSLQTWWMNSTSNTGFKGMTHRTGNTDYDVNPPDVFPPIFTEWWVPLNEDLVSPFTTPPQNGNAGNAAGGGPTPCAGVAARTRVDFAFQINATKDLGVNNDVCASATNVYEGTTPFSNVGALDDAPDTSCANSGSDIWFRHETTCDGVLRVSTCGADFDTIVEVYTGCGGTSLGCSDNDCDADDADLSITVFAGELLWIRVAGSFFQEEGKGGLTIACDEVCGADDGNPLANNCCSDHSGAMIPNNMGCEIAACCEAVCNTPVEEVCCNDLSIGWDAECAATAEQLPACHCPCTFTCPGGSIQEFEACGNNSNGGCNNLPSAETFESLGAISPGGSVKACGTLQASGGIRDTDWWQLVVGSSGNPLTTLTIEANGEAPIWLFVFGREEFADIGAGETYCTDKKCSGQTSCEAANVCFDVSDCPPNETCDTIGSTLVEYGAIATAGCLTTDGFPNCDPLEVCVPDGHTYSIVVTTGAATNHCELEGNGIFSGVTCGGQDQYRFEVTATDGCLDGACCHCAGWCDDTLNSYECFLAGGRDWNPGTCAGNMCASLAHGCANSQQILCNTTTIVDLSNPAFEIPPEEGYPCEAAPENRPDRMWLSFVAPCVDDDGNPGFNDCNDEPGVDHTSVRLDTCLGVPSAGRDSILAIFGACCVGGTCDSGAQCDSTTFCGAECCDVDNPLRSSGCGDDGCGFTDFLSETCDTALIEGETYLIQISNWQLTLTNGVFSLRLTCPCTGSCCDQTTGICQDNVASDDCQEPLDFSTEFTCATLPSVCGLGACCHSNGTCTNTTLPNCQAPGDNHHSNTTCSTIVCPVDNSCDYNTGDPANDLDQATFGLRSQYAYDIDLFVEVADQFEMKGSEENDCRIERIDYSVFHVGHDIPGGCLQGGGANCVDSPLEYEGIILTISTDVDGDEKAPECSPTCSTTECSGGPTFHAGPGCVHEIRFNAAIDKGDPPPPGNYWEYFDSGSGQPEWTITLHFDPPLVIEKNRKHWLAMTHVVPQTSRYSVIWFASNNYNGNPTQIWNSLGSQEWEQVAGLPNDQLFAIQGNKFISDCSSCMLYGDLVPANCLVDIDDYLCVLNAFSGLSLFPPCTLNAADIHPCDPDGQSPWDHGDGDVDSDDLLASIYAFQGIACCPDPCPPGACTGDFGSGAECRDGTYFPGGMSASDCFIAGGTYCGNCTVCGGPCPGSSVCPVPLPAVDAQPIPELPKEDSRAVHNLAYTLVPVVGPNPDPGDSLTVEVHITATSSNAIITGGQWDLPCNVPGSIGSLGMVGGPGPSSNAVVGNNGSSFGVPLLFGSGLSVPNQTECKLAFLPGLVGGTATLMAGQTRYVGEITYQVSNDASGIFVLALEGISSPAQPNDTTRVSAPGADCGGSSLHSVKAAPLVITVNGGCGPCRLHGDFVVPYCVIDSCDLQCVLEGFINIADCPEADVAPCGGDGIIDIQDVIEFLNAMIGMGSCVDPCPPGACELAPPLCSSNDLSCSPVGGSCDSGAGNCQDCRDGTHEPGGMSQTDCAALGGTYLGDLTSCSLSPLPATVGGESGNVEARGKSGCLSLCGDCQLYADIVPRKCLIDVDDILCVLNAFVSNPAQPGSPPGCSLDVADIEPCDPDGISPFDHGDADVDSDDIINLLVAFEGFPRCPDPCPPGACVVSSSVCFDQLNCLDGSSTLNCVQANGAYLGDYTICPNPPEFICGDGLCLNCETPCTCWEDCGRPRPEGCGPTCRDGVDNDCDGVLDCGDPGCSGEPNCDCGDGVCRDGENNVNCPGDCIIQQFYNFETPCRNCTDHLDNNANGLTDCQEPSCSNERACVCDDSICSGCENPCICPADCGTSTSAENSNLLCSDNRDNDCDGKTDCSDEDCRMPPVSAALCGCGGGNTECGPGESPCNCPANCGAPSPSEISGVTCNDGLDNDCDTLTDCADSNCASDLACTGCP